MKLSRISLGVLGLISLFAARSVVAGDAFSALTQETRWLNTSRALTAADLKGRIVLVDFWTFCCINCQHVIADLQALEEKFGDRLTVVGVHSAKFTNEKETRNIRDAILRYGIGHPVVNDADFRIWNAFHVDGWPHFTLIDPDGNVVRDYSGEGQRERLQTDIAALVGRFGARLNLSPLPLARERDRAPETVLRFPGKLVYVPKLDGKPALIVSDSSHDRLVVLGTDGHVRDTIGKKNEPGLVDGSFEAARFRTPQGLIYREGILYVAETGNHDLRRVDFKQRQVTRVAGTGHQGEARSPRNAPALTTALNSPWDIAFFPSPSEITIAMAGSHQLWVYDTKKNTLRVLAGDGREGLVDGPASTSSLAQPSGLSARAGELYFVDSESSSLRVVNREGTVRTLVGSGLFHFGFHDGGRAEAALQHPLGVLAEDGHVFVADSYNHALRSYDLASGKLTTIAGTGKPGARDGKGTAALFDEPNAVVRGGAVLYVADTDNHAVRIILPAKKTVRTLELVEAERKTSSSSRAAPSETLPRVKKDPRAKVAAGQGVTVRLALETGWELNRQAPSWMELFEVGPRTRSVKRFGKDELAQRSVTLPPLLAGHRYRLQGTFYFCREGNNGICVLQSHDGELEPTEKAAIELTLPLRGDR